MPQNNHESEILTIKKVAENQKAAERTTYQVVETQRIRAFKVGGAWRFRTAECAD